jgi:Glycosyl transferase family 90
MDIYNMGNVLFMILVGRQPFGKMKRWDVHKRIMERTQIMDEIPDTIRESKDSVHQALVKTVDWCRREDPKERPMAKEVVGFLTRLMKGRNSYGSVETMNQRRKRFPSFKDRIKLYMSSWYVLPCAEDDNGGTSPFIQYQYITEAKSRQSDVLVRAPQTQPGNQHRIVRLGSDLRTDEAMIVVPENFRGSSIGDNIHGNISLAHAGFRVDIVNTILPHVELLHGKPIITQWGDKRKLIVSSLQNSKASSSSRRRVGQEKALNVSLPHLKKCRRSIRKEDLKLITRETCYNPANRPHPKSPIIWRLDSNRLLGLVPLVAKQDKPWREKHFRAIWRGRLTGHAMTKDGQPADHNRQKMTEESYCRAIKRCKFVLHYHNSSIVDARLVSLQSKQLNGTVAGVPLTTLAIEMRDFLDHKVLILLEGNDVASGLGWSLRSNSVVMMPPPTMTSWLMEELLEPWVHYIPLNESLDDVEEKMAWVREHDSEAEQIARRGSLWMMDLLEHPDSKSDEERIFRGILERYERLFVPSWKLKDMYQDFNRPGDWLLDKKTHDFD